jgi:hypothetical protein
MKTSNTDTAAATPPKGNGYVVTIPLLTLATNDGTSAVSPAVGDSVEIQASGTVKSIEGDNAKISIESINGNPLAESEPPAVPAPAPDTAASLRAAAQTADESNSY